MSLENKLQDLIGVLEKNTASNDAVVAAITAAGLKPKPTAAAAVRDEVIPEDEGETADAPAAEPAAKKPGRPKKDAGTAAKVYTSDEVAAMAGKVKETFGKDKAVALIGEYTEPKGGKLSAIPEKKYGAFVTAAEALIIAGVQEDTEEEEEDL